jgi:hypothetical protein
MPARFFLGALSLGALLACQAFAQEQALREAARLDAEHQCGEAERYYQKALASAPCIAAGRRAPEDPVRVGADYRTQVFGPRLYLPVGNL